MTCPNIVYLHAHDLGRYCEPFGYAIPAPNLMRLALQGVLFRQCHAASPSCAPSRAALFSGQHPHVNGMMGLPAPRLGYRMHDYGLHLAGWLREQGYETALSGVQHEAHQPFADPLTDLPYSRFLNHTAYGPQNFDARLTVPAAVEYLAEAHAQPFFLSVGLLDPHRDNRGDRRCFIESQPHGEPHDIDERARYCSTFPHLPDNAVTRREMANFRMGVELMDGDIGRLLNALDRPELRRNTLVIFSTDHGPGVCEMKCTLSDRGTGVTLIMRGPTDQACGPASLFAGGRVSDALVQHLDLYPTIAEVVGKAVPAHCQGVSLLPLLRDGQAEIHERIFTEQTYHWSSDPRPLRAVRTTRWKYIRSWKADQGRGVDTGPAERFLNDLGYGDRPWPDEMLYELAFDPHEACNLAADPAYVTTLTELRGWVQTWMEATDDPLRHGIPEPPVASGRLANHNRPGGPGGG